MINKNSVNSEEFVFYIDLATDFLKKKNMAKILSQFAKEKEKFSIPSTFGLLMFQEEENLLTTYDKQDAQILANIINSKWESREVNRSFLENGLFEILAYVFKKSLEGRKNFRIIVISDTPSGLPESYHHALYDLLLKAKNFNVFIDIIRVGDEKFYPDDVKLKVITSETRGGVFYCSDPKLFQNILNSLMQNKTEFTVIQSEEDENVLREDKLFYEKLAVDLISLNSDDKEICDICEQELCPICEAHSDEIHKCFNCDAKYHSCCAAKFALTNNIGIKHLFRCVRCDTLLKLDEEFVEMIYAEEFEVEEVPEQIEMFDEELEEEEEVFVESFEEEEIINESIVDDDASFQEYTTKKVKIGGFFGQEVEIKAPNNNLPKPTDSVINSEEGETQVEETISITSLRPPKKKTIKLCNICGTTIRNAHICPMCGARVD